MTALRPYCLSCPKVETISVGITDSVVVEVAEFRHSCQSNLIVNIFVFGVVFSYEFVLIEGLADLQLQTTPFSSAFSDPLVSQWEKKHIRAIPLKLEEV